MNIHPKINGVGNGDRIQTSERQELWLLEVFNDKEANRPYETILKHREVLILGSPSEKYTFTIANKILCIFTQSNTYKKVKERFDNDERMGNFREYFKLIN